MTSEGDTKLSDVQKAFDTSMWHKIERKKGGDEPKKGTRELAAPGERALEIP